MALFACSGCLRVGPPTLGRPVAAGLSLIQPDAEMYLTSAWPAWLAAGLAVGGLWSLGWLALSWRRVRQGVKMDREDQALLRTARDAVMYLVKKHRRRLRPGQGT